LDLLPATADRAAAWTAEGEHRDPASGHEASTTFGCTGFEDRLEHVSRIPPADAPETTLAGDGGSKPRRPGRRRLTPAGPAAAASAAQTPRPSLSRRACRRGSSPRPRRA